MHDPRQPNKHVRYADCTESRNASEWPLQILEAVATLPVRWSMSELATSESHAHVESVFTPNFNLNRMKLERPSVPWLAPAGRLWHSATIPQ
eukprot:3001356-Amphidinium_carterae.1